MLNLILNSLLLMFLTGSGLEPQSAQAQLAPRPMRHAREQLARFLIDESQLNGVEDGQPLGPNDEELLLKLLFRMPKLNPLDLERWTVAEPDWEALQTQPREHRVDTWQLRGTIQDVQRIELPNELSVLFQFDHYFVTELQLGADSGKRRVQVCSRAIPARWQTLSPTGSPIGQPAVATGLFLKSGGKTGPAAVFVCKRVEWFPDTIDPDLGVVPELCGLAAQGFDVGLLDDVIDGQPLQGEDRECFYQMLHAVGKPRRDSQAPTSPRSLSLATLLTQPQTQRGHQLLVKGVARQVNKVIVDDPDIQARLGIQSYYQIDVFVELDRSAIQLSTPNTPEGPVYRNEYPVTVCVHELPAAFRPWLEGATEPMIIPVEFPAYFLKIWSYRSQYSAAASTRQPSPLLIGLRAEVPETEAGLPAWVGLVSGLSFVGVLAILWFWLWRDSRGNEQFEQRTAHLRARSGPIELASESPASESPASESPASDLGASDRSLDAGADR